MNKDNLQSLPNNYKQIIYVSENQCLLFKHNKQLTKNIFDVNVLSIAKIHRKTATAMLYDVKLS